jgi:hypothetical protein
MDELQLVLFQTFYRVRSEGSERRKERKQTQVAVPLLWRWKKEAESSLHAFLSLSPPYVFCFFSLSSSLSPVRFRFPIESLLRLSCMHHCAPASGHVVLSRIGPDTTDVLLGVCTPSVYDSRRRQVSLDCISQPSLSAAGGVAGQLVWGQGPPDYLLALSNQSWRLRLFVSGRTPIERASSLKKNPSQPMRFVNPLKKYRYQYHSSAHPAKSTPSARAHHARRKNLRRWASLPMRWRCYIYSAAPPPPPPPPVSLRLRFPVQERWAEWALVAVSSLWADSPCRSRRRGEHTERNIWSVSTRGPHVGSD